jgi:hypothetical protein
MIRLSRVVFVALGVGVVAVAAGAGLAACSSTSGGGATPCTSANNVLEVAFNPMYSAYEPSHKYQVPAIVNGISGSVSWSASDMSAVSLAPDPDTGGIMITVNSAGTGTVTITATAGGLCGTSVLNITPAMTTDWMIGSARYNDGTALHFGHGGVMEPTDGGGGPACTNCHGATATDAGPFMDISHTPQQTGGFSDQDLINIILHGEVPGWDLTTGAAGPDAGYFDPSIISYKQWNNLHQWTDITSDEYQGIVVYLRSLTPASQNGTSDFGGHGFGGDGGMHHHDGGGGFGGDSGGGGGGPDSGGGGPDAGGGG